MKEVQEAIANLVKLYRDDLRHIRDQRESTPEVRQAFNKACDALDVLHSKLIHKRAD